MLFPVPEPVKGNAPLTDSGTGKKWLVRWKGKKNNKPYLIFYKKLS